MEPKKSKKETEKKAAKAKNETEQPESSENNAAEESKEDKDDELSAEHVKGLDEALKNSGIGEPITLKEFKKMSKKWSSK